MKYRIEYLSTFHTDILSIADYLAEYPQKAIRIFAKVDKALGNLGDMPEIYPIYDPIPSFRFFITEDYLVFYKIKKQMRVIEIHRMIHGRMDISALLS